MAERTHEGQVDLQPLGTGHAEVVARWLSDPATNRWLSGDLRQQQITERQVALLAANPRNRLWMITLNGAPAGIVVLSQIDVHDRSARIWYLVEEAHRGQGVARRAVCQAVWRGFNELGLESINASVMEPNTPSAQVLIGAGFRPVGILRRGLQFEGRFVDRLLYDIVRTDLDGVEG